MEKPIQPVVRTLSLLRCLNHFTHATLSDLQKATGLPKATTHRLLATLKAEGYVRNDVITGVYSLTEKVRELSEGFTVSELVVALGAPIIVRSTRQSGLPMAIGILERGRIVVRYSSMPYSPLAPGHTTVGHSHSLVQSGMGQAYMAWCSSEEREHLKILLASASENGRAASQLLKELDTETDRTRARGFGLRLPSSKNSTATMAVPIKHPNRLLGVLAITTFGSLLNAKTQHQYLALLRETSEEISSTVQERETAKHPKLP